MGTVNRDLLHPCPAPPVGRPRNLIDLGPAPLGPYARGPHYDAGFTLLVPVFSLDGTGQELQLDLESCYAWLCLPEQIGGTSVREAWQDCLGPPVPGGRDSAHRIESEGSPNDWQSSVDQPHGYISESEPQVSLEKSPSNVSGPESPGQDVTDRSVGIGQLWGLRRWTDSFRPDLETVQGRVWKFLE